MLPSVVLVESSCERGRVIFGSGFVIDKGLVATNKHVVECGSEAYVALVGQDTKHRVTAKYLDSAHDLAVLKVEGLTAPALLLSDAQNLAVGDKVYAAGNPKGLEGTFSDGIVSSLRYSAGRIQFTAAISPGSSGGPVVDEYGRVIGVTVSYLEGGQNLNFAVPSLFLKTLIADVRNGKAADALTAKAAMPPGGALARHAGAISYTLVIDNSSTLKEQFVFVKQIASALIEHNNVDDGARIVSFRAGGERRTARFTTDRRVLLESIEAIEARSETSTQPVIDAVQDAVQSASYPTRSYDTDAVIVLTHDMDSVSEHTWDSLLTFARTHKIPIYCILFAPESPNWNSYADTGQMLAAMAAWEKRMKTGEQALRALTQETDGQLFIVKDEGQLSQLADEIIRRLHTSLKRAAAKPAHGRGVPNLALNIR